VFTEFNNDISALSVLAYTNDRGTPRRQTLETAYRQQCRSVASQLIPDIIKDCCAVHDHAIAATSQCTFLVTECPRKSAYRTLSQQELIGFSTLRAQEHEALPQSVHSLLKSPSLYFHPQK